MDTATKCECGNEAQENNTQCEWCEYPSMGWVMWREAVGAGYLEQMETHGMDAYYAIEREHKGESIRVGVFANSQEIAEYIADEYLARKKD